MESLERAGLSMKGVTDKLLDDGLRQFVDAFAQLLKATGTRKSAESSAKINSLSYALPQKTVGGGGRRSYGLDEKR